MAANNASDFRSSIAASTSKRANLLSSLLSAVCLLLTEASSTQQEVPVWLSLTIPVRTHCVLVSKSLRIPSADFSAFSLANIKVHTKISSESHALFHHCSIYFWALNCVCTQSNKLRRRSRTTRRKSASANTRHV